MPGSDTAASSQTGGQQAATPATTATPVVTTQSAQIKVNLPDTFSGKQSSFKTFTAQIELYIGFNSAKFVTDTDKVLWSVSFLRGPAFDWVQPFLEDFLGNRAANGGVSTAMKEETKEIFRTFKGFKQKIASVFGDIDPKRNAERALRSLRQTGSAVNYTAQFQQHKVKTGWNDEALQAQYYQGLKDSVKDEISRSDDPGDLRELMTIAVKIDNRLYERSLERKGQYNRMGNRQPQKKSRWPEPMELDATRVGNHLPKEEMDKRRKEGLCFECGKPGHRASFHRKNQGKKPWKGRTQQLKMTQLPKPEPEIECLEFKLTPEQEHACLSWTACYDDHCLVHRSDKDGSGYFPRRPKNKARKARGAEDSE
jgi:hypothetical protein